MKLIRFAIAEEIKVEKSIIKQGIYNRFGKVYDLPPSVSYNFNELSFKPKELGDCFIELGEKIKSEKKNIKNIKIETSITPREDYMGKKLLFSLFYEEVNL